MTFKHGAGGYRRHNCRCEVCRAGHASEQRVQRAKAADRGSVVRFPVNVPARTAERVPVERGSSTEAKTARQIEDMAADRAWTSECARLEDQALTAARVIDKVIADGRVHLAPAHFRLLNDALERLQALLAPDKQERGHDDEDRMGFPREMWEDLSFLRTCNIGWFPKSSGGEFESTQRICTLPRGHAGPHSDDL